MVLILLADKRDIAAAQYCISITELYIVARCPPTHPWDMCNLGLGN